MDVPVGSLLPRGGEYSDHSLNYVVRKAHYVQTDAKIIEARTMRNFNSENFLNYLDQQPWAEV